KTGQKGGYPSIIDWVAGFLRRQTINTNQKGNLRVAFSFLGFAETRGFPLAPAGAAGQGERVQGEGALCCGSSTA
ncbi:MAG: hypothetical protein IJM64_01780, partial [Ottowia sp.]|nr:hypothetical protein [Ottowia sp.]